MSMWRVLLIGACCLLAATAGFAGSNPVAVSPGDASRLALTDTRCPTFSWGAVDGAKGYELVVYRLDDDGEEAEPVVTQRVSGSALAWTPALDRCLERGGRYAWSVRAVGEKAASDWSAPSLFQVASGPREAEFEEALAVVRSYLEEADSGTAPGSGEIAGSQVGISATAVSPSARGSIAGAAQLSGVAGDSALQVNDAAVVTTATLGIGVGLQLCEAVDYRYVDLGNGTVLDCSTDLIWLKDGSCADLAGTDADGQANWATAQSAAAALSDGTCGLTDGSSAGDWRQPTILELCSAWMGSPLVPCPAGAASDSLLDSSVSGSPKVVNALGDAKWSEGDAFVGLYSTVVGYWSATQNGIPYAWTGYTSNGEVASEDKDDLHFVWPVRGGQ